jgi:hypothetical protein
MGSFPGGMACPLYLDVFITSPPATAGATGRERAHSCNAPYTDATRQGSRSKTARVKKQFHIKKQTQTKRTNLPGSEDSGASEPVARPAPKRAQPAFSLFMALLGKPPLPKPAAAADYCDSAAII